MVGHASPHVSVLHSRGGLHQVRVAAGVVDRWSNETLIPREVSALRPRSGRTLAGRMIFVDSSFSFIWENIIVFLLFLQCLMCLVCGEVLAHHVCSSRSIRGRYTPSELVRMKVFEADCPLLLVGRNAIAVRAFRPAILRNPDWAQPLGTHGRARK